MPTAQEAAGSTDPGEAAEEVLNELRDEDHLVRDGAPSPVAEEAVERMAERWAGEQRRRSNDEPPYIGYCRDCGAKHEVGPELEPEERGCMCGGQIVPRERLGDLDQFALEVRSEAKRRWGDVPVTVRLLVHHDQETTTAKAFHTFYVKRREDEPNVIERLELLDNGSGDTLEVAERKLSYGAMETLDDYILKDDGWLDMTTKPTARESEKAEYDGR